MIALLDLNVILDVVLARNDFLEAAETLSLARSGVVEAYLPNHALTTIHYVLR